MSPRTIIFISAVSRELKSARQLVANTLTFLGYEPEWLDIFGTEEGDLREMLRRGIDSCKGVVQLVGECSGAEPLASMKNSAGLATPSMRRSTPGAKERKSGICSWTRAFPPTRMKRR